MRSRLRIVAATWCIALFVRCADAQLAGPAWLWLAQRAPRPSGGVADASTHPDRQRLFDQYRQAALEGGNPDRGKFVFEKQCSTCHEIDGLGQPVGPSLISAASRGLDHVLWNILDPSRDLDSQYMEYQVTTTDGAVVCGMIVAETTTTITLIDFEAARTTIARSRIEKLQATGKSIMPDRFDKVITRDSMADLIAFLHDVGAVQMDSRGGK